MDIKYSLKNFRVFDDRGASFDMTPITILTGCNSSGKSSVVKSMMLLKECIRRAKEQYEFKGTFNPAECYLDFSADGLNLKSFDSAVNRKSEKKGDAVFIFSNWCVCYLFRGACFCCERE